MQPKDFRGIQGRKLAQVEKDLYFLQACMVKLMSTLKRKNKKAVSLSYSSQKPRSGLYSTIFIYVVDLISGGQEPKKKIQDLQRNMIKIYKKIKDCSAPSHCEN